MRKPSAYISGPLHSASDLAAARRFYEALASCCQTVGWEAYLPHLRSDPERHPSLSAEDVFRMDVEMLRRSSAVVADIGSPSAGVGGELVLAWSERMPIIAVRHQAQSVSRFVLGLLSASGGTLIVYRSVDDCCAQLQTALGSCVKR